MFTKREMLLLKIMEECDELSQRCSKALRFGLFEVQDGQVFTNAARIQQEYGDLMGVYDLLVTARDLQLPTEKQIKDHQWKIEKYFQYSIEQGILSPDL